MARREKILEFDNVSFSHGNTRPVVENAVFSVKEGDFIIIKGPSGTGKSTLLRLCCRLEQPDSGIIRYKGEDIVNIPPWELRRKVCLVRQTPIVIPGSLRNNILLPFTFKSNRRETPPSEDTIVSILDEFQLGHLAPDFPALNLSVGQKQRLCLIRALLMNPNVMLLDEPTSALDEKSAAIVLNRTQVVNQQKGVTVLMVTHANQDITMVSPSILEMENGRATLI